MSIISEWEAAKFIDVADALFDTTWIDEIPTTNTTVISEAQSQALSNSIIACVRAFSSGSYDSYRAFVTPIPLSVSSNRVATMAEFLRNPSSKPTIGSTPEIRDPKLAKQIVEGGSPENIHRAYFDLVSDYTSYKDYWQAIAVDSSWVTTFSAYALPTDLIELVFDKMQNVGVFLGLPSFDCLRRASDCLQLHQALSCADICLLVRLKAPDPVAPFVFRFFWDPEEKVWIPYGLAIANTYSNTAIQPAL
ncbi:MAG: hypothetical protein H7A45_06785 [Verrucomicrobiales bacterium]|nr:hypothetical protein [Verrucomicrobiales bacterium]